MTEHCPSDGVGEARPEPLVMVGSAVHPCLEYAGEAQIQLALLDGFDERGDKEAGKEEPDQNEGCVKCEDNDEPSPIYLADAHDRPGGNATFSSGRQGFREEVMFRDLIDWKYGLFDKSLNRDAKELAIVVGTDYPFRVNN